MTLSNISSPGAVPIFQSLNTRFLESSSNASYFSESSDTSGRTFPSFNRIFQFPSSFVHITYACMPKNPLSACLICFKFPPVNPRLISVVIRNNSYNRSFSILIRTEKELITEVATSGKKKNSTVISFTSTLYVLISTCISAA